MNAYFTFAATVAATLPKGPAHNGGSFHLAMRYLRQQHALHASAMHAHLGGFFLFTCLSLHMRTIASEQ